MATQHVTFQVEAREAGLRLDRLITSRVQGLGRRRARDLFRSSRVRVDGRVAQGGESARAGQQISLELEDETPIPQPELALDVRLELPVLVVIEKPAGQATVPLAAGELGSVANALLARFPEMASVGYRPREPGLIHRLDTQTSGLLVAARSHEAFAALSAALGAGLVQKTYLAVCEDQGLADSGTIERPLGPDPRRPERVLVFESMPQDRYARRASTRYRVLERRSGLLLVELEAPHAMRHQIRAHLAALGHPILGDVVYGRGALPELGARHALHASYVAWAGDGTLPSFAVRSNLPLELARLLG